MASSGFEREVPVAKLLDVNPDPAMMWVENRYPLSTSVIVLGASNRIVNTHGI
jgi:hypothetical protein